MRGGGKQEEAAAVEGSVFRWLLWVGGLQVAAVGWWPERRWHHQLRGFDMDNCCSLAGHEDLTGQELGDVLTWSCRCSWGPVSATQAWEPHWRLRAAWGSHQAAF